MIKHVFANGLFRLLRAHQWSKNMLCFVPLFAAHRWNDSFAWIESVKVAVLISVAASALYITNDLVDIESDKIHPDKKQRPLASGQVDRLSALVLSAGLLLGAVVMAFFLSFKMLFAVAGYTALSAAYTFLFKKMPVIDMVILSLLYGCRLVSGAVAAHILLSDWLLSFSFFLMLSLAAVKRHAELLECLEGAQVRGYDFRDISFVRSLGLSSAVASSIVLCLYIQSPHVVVLYACPTRLWITLPLFVCWVALLWRKAVRGEVHSDPVLHVIKDPSSYVFLGMAVFAIAIAHPLPT